MGACNLSTSAGKLFAGKGKGKGQTLDIAPQVRQAYLRGAQVHGAARTKQRRSRTYLPLNLPSRSRYSFTDHLRMEG